MRALPALIFAAALAGLTPSLAFAQYRYDAEDVAARAERRVELLADLTAAQSEAEAAPIVNELWRIWRTGPDVVAIGLLLDAEAHLRVADVAGALEILDQLTVEYPTWAEAWNMRATVYFYEDRYEDSLADIMRVLELEPSHFGALVGRGFIHLRSGRPEEARAALEEAIVVNPWLPERHLLTQPPLSTQN